MNNRIIKFRGKSKQFSLVPKEGDRVVVFDPGSHSNEGCPQIGTSNERIGVLKRIVKYPRETLTGGVVDEIGEVVWEGGPSGDVPISYYLKTLYCVDEFVENFPPEHDPKFNVNDIVYIGYRPDRSGDHSWPMVNTDEEIDCKITDIYTSPLKFYRRYSLISGNGYPFAAKEEDLITVKQRDEYIEGNQIYTAAEDAPPFYKAGHQFKKIGNYLVSKDPDISIHVSKIKNNNFLCTTLDK